MAAVTNNLGSNPELRRGVQKLYDDLKKATQDNDGKVDPSFSESFTNADGDIKITVSALAFAAYAGAVGSVDDRGDVVQKDDVGISFKMESTEGGASSTGSSLSNPMRDIKDLDDNMADQLALFPASTIAPADSATPNTSITQDSDQPSLSDLAAKIQPGSHPNTTAIPQAKQQSTDSLIDALTKFLKGQKTTDLTPLESLLTQKSDDNDDAGQKETDSSVTQAETTKPRSLSPTSVDTKA